MAWITEKPDGFLVRWRDAEGRTVSHWFSAQAWSLEWGNNSPEEALARARADAEMWRAEKTRTERRSMTAVKRLPKLTGVPLFTPGYSEPQYVFENYARRIIERDSELRPTSREAYLGVFRVHIEGTALGRSDIHEIAPEMVSDFWTTYADSGTGTRRNVYRFLAKVFNRAVKDELIDRSPLTLANDVKHPRKEREDEVDPLTVGQIELLAVSATNERDRLAILVMAYGGLRAGEVGGLRFDDVDFERCRFRIRQQVARANGNAYISALKTKSARRTVDMPSSVTNDLKEFLRINPPTKDGRIFYGANEGLWPNTAINHAVHRAARRAGLTGVFSHRLRHTAVSLLIDDGANPKAIQAFVGHATIKETLQTYGHLFDYGGSALAASMERRRDEYRNGRTLWVPAEAADHA
jgi:integrase